MDTRFSVRGRASPLLSRLMRTLAFAAGCVGAGVAVAATTSVQLNVSGTGSLAAVGAGVDGVQDPELDGGIAALESEAAEANGSVESGGHWLNRSIAKAIGTGPAVSSSRRAKSNPELALTVDGLNFRQQRLANGGNQFSVEPPDQAL